PPLVTGSITTGMFDVNGDAVADLVATSYAPGYCSGPPTQPCIAPFDPYGLAMFDGVTGTALMYGGFAAPATGFWANGPDYLPSVHTALGNWVGDGQLNWLWLDGVPLYVDPA